MKKLNRWPRIVIRTNQRKMGATLSETLDIRIGQKYGVRMSAYRFLMPSAPDYGQNTTPQGPPTVRHSHRGRMGPYLFSVRRQQMAY